MSAIFHQANPPLRSHRRAPVRLDVTTALHLDPTVELFDEHTIDIPTEAANETPPQSNVVTLVNPTAAPQVAPIVPNENPTAPQTDTVIPSPGVVLNDRFLLDELIGVGGSAVVYRAKDLQWNTASSADAACDEIVAIKMPRPETTDLPRARLRLMNEHRIMRALSHPNIVRVFDVYANGACFMTMEHIHGELLSALLQERLALTTELTRKILYACAQALSHAHANHIVHGDFKPSNVFVMADERVKVFDFGAAVSPLSAETRIAVGTSAYSSPEVLSGETPTVQDDVFSFACVAYQLLNSRHPFSRYSSLEARSKGLLPLRAWNLHSTQWLALLSALSWQRDQRPNSIKALVDALLAEQDGAIAKVRAPAVPAVKPAVANAPVELAPPQHRTFRRFVFVCASLMLVAGPLAVALIAAQRQSSLTASGAENAPPNVATASTGPIALATTIPADIPTVRDEVPTASTDDSHVAPVATAAPRPARSEISFESSKITTSKHSVSVVFLIKRSPPLTGRVRVKWRAEHEATSAPVDFASVTSGTVEFADGQALRALYVPLHNDSLTENDRSFVVRLHSPQSARLGSIATAQATLLQ